MPDTTPSATPAPRKLSPLTLLGLLVGVLAIGLAWSGGCVGGDGWERTQVCSFVNESADEVRVLACYFGEQAWVPVFHGPTHHLTEGGRMQAAASDPAAAWLPAEYASSSDLYRPEVVAGVTYRVQVRDADGVRSLPDVDVAFVPGRHVNLRLGADGALVVVAGDLLTGLGVRPDTRWGEPVPVASWPDIRDAAELPAEPAP